MSSRKHYSKQALKTAGHVDVDRLFPPTDEASELLVACRRMDYSASAIARAVEDCDAHLLNLNLTGDSAPDGSDDLMVELRVGLRNANPVARSLERYGYRVMLTRHGMYNGYCGEEIADPAVERVKGLLAQIEV